MKIVFWHSDMTVLLLFLLRICFRQDLCKSPILIKTSLLLHFAYPLTVKVVGAPQITSKPVSSIFSILHCRLWLGEPQACQPPEVVFPPLFLLLVCLPCLLPPFTVPCKMVLARPDERETCPYHFSLLLFTMVSRSSCGPTACCILAQTSSLVTLSLYQMRSILLILL